MAAKIEHVPAIEAEDGDGFSDIGSSIGSSTQSLTESIHQFFEQNGRRYQTYFGPNKNPMPNDAKEQERLDIAHEMCLLICNGSLQQAPVKDNRNIQRVLDLGTGTGIWAIDFAFENPHAEVVGVDLSPIQPNWVAPNCRFEVDDFELEWMYKNKFDFINARCITQSVNDWPKLLKQAKDHLNPGGYLELAEFSFNLKCDDGTMPDNWPPNVLMDHLKTAMRKQGRLPPMEANDLRRVMENAGFVDIHAKTFKLPDSPWPKRKGLKEAGGLNLLSVQTGYEAYTLAMLTRVLEMEEGKVLELIREAVDAHRDNRVHAYYEFYTVYGRKAEEEPQ